MNVGTDLPLTLKTIDTASVHNVDVCLVSNQHQGFDTGDPKRDICHGDSKLLAWNVWVRTIPVSVLHKQYLLHDQDMQGHINTGTSVSCSNALHLFHDIANTMTCTNALLH